MCMQVFHLFFLYVCKNTAMHFSDITNQEVVFFLMETILRNESYRVKYSPEKELVAGGGLNPISHKGSLVRLKGVIQY